MPSVPISQTGGEIFTLSIQSGGVEWACFEGEGGDDKVKACLLCIQCHVPTDVHRAGVHMQVGKCFYSFQRV